MSGIGGGCFWCGQRVAHTVYATMDEEVLSVELCSKCYELVAPDLDNRSVDVDTLRDLLAVAGEPEPVTLKTDLGPRTE